MLVRSSSRKSARAFFYGCMTYHLRGRTACANNLLIPMERTNEAVLRVLERDVLHPDVISKVVDKALDKFKASEIECKERRHSLYKQIKDVDVEIERLVAAISAGGDIPVLVTAVKAAKERRSALSSDLA